MEVIKFSFQPTEAIIFSHISNEFFSKDFNPYACDNYLNFELTGIDNTNHNYLVIQT